MASETEFMLGLNLREGPWPPDDTEESVVGTDLHQMTIINLRLGINEAAQSHLTPGQAVPWQALSQTVVYGFARPDDSNYKALPDVFVYPHAVAQNRGSLSLVVDGPPVLIIEVLSESTYASDLDLTHGKAYSYAKAGVHEYLTIDPTGMFLAERGRGWRLTHGVYRPWEAEPQGRWQSEQIGVAFGIEGALAAVYASDGRRMLREGEIEAELARLRRLLDER